MKISEKNQCMINNLSIGFDISKNQVIDNIITEYRARRASKRLEFNEPDFLLEFSKIDDKLLTGEHLFVFLVTQYRQDMEKERNDRSEREYKFKWKWTAWLCGRIQYILQRIRRKRYLRKSERDCWYE